MRRQTRANLVLASAVALLAVFLLWSEPTEKSPAPKPLTPIAAAAVQAIHVDRTQGQAMHFERHGEHWLMTAPVGAPAYGTRISAILGLLAEPSHAQLAVSKKELARFKLDAPAVTLRLDGHEVAFGDTDPLNDRRYVRFEGRVHLIADTLYFQLTQNPGFFIEPRLLPEDAVPVRIAYPEFTLSEQDGTWTQQPDAGLGAGKLKAIALNWETARAITVRTPLEGAAGGQVEIETRAGERVRFDILAQEPNLILGRADLGVQYHMDNYTAEQLLLRNDIRPAKAKSD